MHATTTLPKSALTILSTILLAGAVFIAVPAKEVPLVADGLKKSGSIERSYKSAKKSHKKEQGKSSKKNFKKSAKKSSKKSSKTDFRNYSTPLPVLGGVTVFMIA